MYLVLSARGDRGYFSSNRPGSLYLDEKNKTCCNDIFSFTVKQDTAQPSPETQLPRTIQEQPDTIMQVPVRERPEDFGGLPLYFDNDQPDSRTRNTSHPKNIRKKPCASISIVATSHRTRYTAGLKGSSAEDAASASDSFFDDEVRAGAERLSQLCELLLERLESGEAWEIQLRGFTSPRAESDYNLFLARRRTKSVMNELETWQDGSLKKFIDGGQLKISELSLGETASKVGISDKITDEKNSIYHPDAARERRVEIVRIIDLKF
jgi:outer membrane protein OmpA-like peptidoglycan-associated protein